VTSREERAGRRWLAAWRFVRRLPEPAATFLGRAGGLLFYRLDARRRAALRANLRQVLGPRMPARRLERVVRKGFVSYGRYWVEAFRLEDLSQAEVCRRMALEGREHLEKALAAGHGIVFATPHLGNWDVGGAWLAANGYPTTVVVERLRPVEVYERFVAYRENLGMRLLPLDHGSETLRQVIRALRDGQLVALVCDRDLTGGGVPVTVFGRQATMPGGPASLALRTGAALLPCAIYQDRARPGWWEAIVLPPLRVEPSGDNRADVAALTQALATSFERLIAWAPEQWHVLSEYWREPRPRPRADAGAGAGAGAGTEDGGGLL